MYVAQIDGEDYDQHPPALFSGDTLFLGMSALSAPLLCVLMH
jgi:hypothetical protein